MNTRNARAIETLNEALRKIEVRFIETLIIAITLAIVLVLFFLP